MSSFLNIEHDTRRATPRGHAVYHSGTERVRDGLRRRSVDNALSKIGQRLDYETFRLLADGWKSRVLTPGTLTITSRLEPGPDGDVEWLDFRVEIESIREGDPT